MPGPQTHDHSKYMTGSECASLIEQATDWLSQTRYKAKSLRIDRTPPGSSTMGSLFLPNIYLNLVTTDIKQHEAHQEDAYRYEERRLVGGLLLYRFGEHKKTIEPWDEKGTTPLLALGGIIRLLKLNIHSVSGSLLHKDQKMVWLEVKAVSEGPDDFEKFDEFYAQENVTPPPKPGAPLAVSRSLGMGSVSYAVDLILEPRREPLAVDLGN